MTLLRASNFCRRTLSKEDNHNDQSNHKDFFQPGIPLGYDIQTNEKTNEDSVSDRQAESMLRLKMNVDVQILSSLCAYCKERHKRKRRQSLRYQYQSSTKFTTISNAGIPADIFSTVFISSSEVLLHLNIFECKNLCLLSSERLSPSLPSTGKRKRNYLTTPVFLCLRSKKCECQTVKIPTSDNKNMKNNHQTVYVPPCVAANAGIFQYAPISMSNVSLKALMYDISNLSNKADEKMEHTIPWADEIHIREVAKPYIDMTLRSQNFLKKSPKQSSRDENLCIQNYFTSKIERTNHRYEERLFQNGHIFAIVDYNLMENNNQIVRFYQVVSCLGETHTSNDSNTKTSCDKHEDIKSKHNKILKRDSQILSSSIQDLCIDDNLQRDTIYRVIPNRTKVILVEKHIQINQPLLPSISSALSFFSSIKLFKTKTRKKNRNRVKIPSKLNQLNQSLANPYLSLDNIISFNDKYTKDLVDAILVCNSMRNTPSNSFLPIVYIVGHDEQDIKKYVEVAADIVGMRYMHVNGLAAFQNRVLQNRSKNITGSLVNKLDAIQSSLVHAKKSNSCVLHVANFSSEIGGNDKEENEEELKRLIAAFAKGLINKHTCTQNIVVVLSSDEKCELLRSIIPLTSPCRTINIGFPESHDIEKLWSDDHTYAIAKLYLRKRSANEILFIRRQLHSYVGHDTKKSELNIKNILQFITSKIDEGNPSKNIAKTSSLIPNIYWEDIGGLSHVRHEIKNSIELPIKYPHMFTSTMTSSRQRFGRSGLLFYGPPGTGKTLVAKAIATEYNLPFLSIKGPELLGTYVGESEANVRKVFAMARQAAQESSSENYSAILFFDELDSLAPRRSISGDSAGGGVMERVVSTLLSELDDGGLQQPNAELKRKEIIFIVGATNRPDLIDPSLLRPGRFDRLIYLGLAKTNEDRSKILSAQMRRFRFEGNKCATDIMNEIIHSIPESLSGADLSAVASGALMRSMRRLCSKVEKEAMEKSHIATRDISKIGPDITADWDLSDAQGLEKLTPIVTIEDVKEAAKDVVPSINELEMQRYESIKSQIQGNQINEI